MDKGTALGKRDTTLPHRHTFTRKIIPATDKRLDEENMARLKSKMKKIGGTIMSDGWQSTTSRPIINVILGVDGMLTLRLATDCSGKDKTMVMCSASACEHCWSVEGWIHSQRRNRLDQKLVEKLVRAHTNLVLRESLDDTLRHLLPWDIELVIDEPVDEQEEEPKV